VSAPRTHIPHPHLTQMMLRDDEEDMLLHGGGALERHRSKHHSPWSLAESQALVDGVAQCSGCRWTAIKKLGLQALERRTAMDLKDKWRNLLQLANLPSQSRRKAETPPSLLDKVRELEAELGPARRKGRKFSLPGNADSAGDAYGSGSQASSQHAHSDADTS